MIFERRLHLLMLWTSVVIRNDDAEGIGQIWDTVQGPVWLDRAKVLARRAGPRRLSERRLALAYQHQSEAMGKVANAVQLVLPLRGHHGG